MDKLIAGIVLWLIIVVVGIPISMLNAHVLTQLWGWFLVPAGLPALAFKTALGVSIIVSFLTHNPLATESTDSDDAPAYAKAFARLGVNLFAVLVFWGTGAFYNWLF